MRVENSDGAGATVKVSGDMPVAVVESERGSDSAWLGTARSLGGKGVSVVRLSPRGWYGSKYCSTILSPDIRDDHELYVRFLVRLGRKLLHGSGHKGVLFPSSDRGLLLMSRNKAVLERFFEVVCPDWGVTERIIDKSKTYEVAKTCNVPIPETHAPNGIDDVKRIAKEIAYPCLIKPAYSHIFGSMFGTKLLRIARARGLCLFSPARAFELGKSHSKVTSALPSRTRKIRI